jgi:ATP/ADP translocase
MFLVFGFYGILPFNLSRILTSLGVARLMTAIGGGIFLIGRALRDGNKWAWNVSWGIGALVMFFGGWTIYESLYAKVRSADDYFGIIVGPFLMLCALIGFVLLVLPQTRRYFAESVD